MRRFMFASLLFCFSTQCFGEETQFMRVIRDKKGLPISVDIPTVRYTKGDTSVDLIGVIHIADKIFFQKLNQQFRQYDSLLFEMVSEDGFKIAEKQKKARNQVQVYELVAFFLDLDDQLSVIDYSVPNLVHADSSPAEILEDMAEHGDDAITIGLSLLADMRRKANLQMKKFEEDPESFKPLEVAELKELSDFIGPKRAVVFKQLFADELDKNGIDQAFGCTINHLLIGDRNAKCIEILESEMKKERKKLGIFYGAAHMKDFEERLLKIGFKKDSVSWETAWDISPKPLNVEKFAEIMEKIFGGEK